MEKITSFAKIKDGTFFLLFLSNAPGTEHAVSQNKGRPLKNC
jgi:hypothetical protein